MKEEKFMSERENDIFVKNCGEHVLQIENDHVDSLWCNFLRVRADPEATRAETNTAGNEFVREFNRLGISVPNAEDED